MKIPHSLAQVALIAALASVAGGLGGCSFGNSKEKSVADGQRDYKAAKYDQAEIEFKNAMQADPKSPEAVRGLALIYFDEGAMTKALPFLARANALQADNVDVTLRMAQIDRDTGKPDAARKVALTILDHDPLNEMALLILVEASTSQKDADDARQRIQQLIAKEPTAATPLLALSQVEFRHRELAGAERDIRKALELDPKSSQAHFALGVILVSKNDSDGAEKELSEAADLSPSHSPLRIQYAQFRIHQKDYEGAKRSLMDTVQLAPDYLPAWNLLAEIAITQRKLDEAAADVGKVLSREPANPEAMLLDGEILRAKGDWDKAIAAFSRVAQLYPQSSLVYYQLGLTYMTSGDLNKAISNLTRSVAISPNSVEAATLLAQANLRKGDYDSATIGLRQIVQQHPNLPQPWLLLADAFRGSGNLEAAINVYDRMGALFPKSPEVPLYKGMVQIQQRKHAEARASFARSLELSADYLPAVEQLINVDLSERKYEEATRRANEEIAKNPSQALPQLLLAKIYVAQSDMDRAESSLQKAIALQPDSPTAYLLLARLYSATHKQEKALADLKAVLAKNPRDVTALMLTANIEEQQNAFEAARDAYEQVLSIDKSFVSALNNLAWIYSDKLGNNDKAFELAQRARDLQPSEPHTADTLGWILYRRHQYPWALSLLQESANRLQGEADVQFHLAMTRYMMGDEEKAREGLKGALGIDPGLEGASDAKEALEILAIDPNQAGPGPRAVLEKVLASRPDDPVALERLASIDTREGSPDKAIAGLEKAMAINPANVGVQISLIQLYLAKHENAKALDIAKQARKLQPDDADVAHLLGKVAYDSKDFAWSFSLDQEAEQAKPSDPAVLFDLGLSAFSVGRVTDSEDAMSRALKAGLSSSQAAYANRFVAMVDLALQPDQVPAKALQIDQALKEDPELVPAVFAKAELLESRADDVAAEDAYRKVLEVFPQFTPATRRLAILGAKDPSKDEETYELAVKAMETYPADTELAKALGLVTYRRKDFRRAASLLAQSADARTEDAELAYYLGKSRLELKDTAEGLANLRKALSLGLTGDLAADARKVTSQAK